MPTKPRTLQRSISITEDIRRHRGDWLAQFLWSYDNGFEHPQPLPTPHRNPAPQSQTYTNDEEGPRKANPPPSIPTAWGYFTYLPPDHRINYPGEKMILTHTQITTLIERMRTHQPALYKALYEYTNKSANQAIYNYWPSKGIVTPTRYGSNKPKLQAAIVWLSDHVEPVGEYAALLQELRIQ